MVFRRSAKQGNVIMSDEKPNYIGISEITVGGFKSLRDETTVEIRPLTILAGANSSGKSSIMQPLLMMKQTLEAPFDPGALLLNGPNVDFTSIEQFLSIESNDKKYGNMVIGCQISGLNAKVTNSYRLNDINSIELYQTIARYPDWEQIYRADMSSEEVKKQVEKWKEKASGNLELLSGEWSVVRDRCFLTFLNFYEGSQSSGVKMSIGSFTRELLLLIHIPNSRLFTRVFLTSAVPTAPNKFYSGTFDNYVASIIDHWQRTNDELLAKLASNLQLLGLTSSVTAKRINDAQIELHIGRTLKSDESDMVSLADVGFGVSQVMPVLVALLAAQPGQLVYIEQPELHLHPKAQVALATVLADAAKRGVRVVAETHSSLLLLAIQTLIAEGKLPNDEVILHWFTRGDDGDSKVEHVTPDENGAYGDWPVDFGSVGLNASSDYLDAVEKRELEQWRDSQEPQMSSD
jgi:hypothetical protein